MKVVLIGPEIEQNLSIRYLASALSTQGHRTCIIPFSFKSELPNIIRRTLKENPGLIGLSLVAQYRFQDFQELICRLRVKGYTGHLTAGGHFASLRSAEVLTHTPGLDTIRQPAYRMGVLGVESLVDRIENDSMPPVHRLLELELIVRGSVSAP